MFTTGYAIAMAGVALCVLLCGIGSSIGLYKTGSAAAGVLGETQEIRQSFGVGAAARDAGDLWLRYRAYRLGKTRNGYKYRARLVHFRRRDAP